MNPYEAYGSPATDKPSARYRDDDYDRGDRERGDSYRRRSPPAERRRPVRDRSRSPAGIDRYQPGRDRPARERDYAEERRPPPRERDDRRRAPSPTVANIDRYVPGQEPEKPQFRQNILNNPLSLDTQVGFSFYRDWWKMEQEVKAAKEREKTGRRPDRVKGEREAREEREKEHAQIQEAYDQYKQDFQVKMARQFVNQHKGEEWFKERYIPEVQNPFRKRLMEFRNGAFDQWQKDMESGVFDEFTLEGIYKNDSDGAGGMVEKEEGEAVGGNEVLGVLDLVAAKGGDLRDDAAQQPALLIKTLAPNVSRDRIEEFCKEQLGEGSGGFKWLSLSDPNPSKKFHRIGWIMLHSASEEDGDVMQVTTRGDGRGEEGEEIDEKPVTSSTSPAQKALELVDSKTITDSIRGDFTCHVGIHNTVPTPRKKALWDLFSAPERVERDYELARRLATKFEAEAGKDEFSGGLAKIDARVEQMRNQGMLQAGPKAKKPNFEDNDDEIKFDEEGEEGEETEEDDDEELLVVKKKLDMLTEYLRRVFNFCLFCVFESDSIHELLRKCPGGHLRRPRAGLSSAAKNAARASAAGDPFPGKKDSKQNGVDDGSESPVQEKRQRFNRTEQQLLRAFNWVKTYEEKVLQILEPEYVDLKKIGGKPVDEAVDEELGKYVKQEDEAKYRCRVPDCQKLFKAEHFWRKHVEKRHDDWCNSLKSDLNLVNTYVLDPSHIAPSRSDANSNGHFPLPANHHLNSGTPRGFSVQNMNMMNFNPNAMMNMSNMASQFMQNAGAFEANGHGGGGGPVRRGGGGGGGGRFGNRSGPYDRGNQGQPRGYNNVGGLMRGGVTPGVGGAGPLSFFAQGGGGGGGKWGDGMGNGVNAIGPREAIQGRTIKSYEDLDAHPAGQSNGAGRPMGGDTGAELDY